MELIYLLVGLIVAILWGQYRYYVGYEIGVYDGFKNVDFKSEMIGSAKLVNALRDNDIIKFLEDGTFIGFNNNEWNAITGKKYNPILDRNENIE